jgi:hypothetical protein
MQGSRKLLLVMAVTLLLLGAVPVLASATDFKIKAGSKVEKRETVERGEVDGFLVKLEEGDKVTWTVNHVAGEDLDVLFMPMENYEQLKSGQGTPWHYQEYSMERTDYIEKSLKAESPYLGEFAIVIKTQDVENATSTYDIGAKLEKAPGPVGLFDQLCSLGTPMCLGLVAAGVVIVLILFFVIRKVTGEKTTDSSTKGEVRYVDTMMRPGFDIPVMPEPEPKKRRKKAKKKGRKKRKRPPRVEVVEAEVVETEVSRECPQCGEPVDEGADFCPSCGSNI